MGYDIHIHRRQEWFDEGSDISVEEWTQLYRADPSFVIDGHVAFGFGAKAEDVPIVGWSAGQETEAAFVLYKGEITTKNPSPAALRKAYEIADKLDARVQGDDGEFYGANGEPIED